VERKERRQKDKHHAACNDAEEGRRLAVDRIEGKKPRISDSEKMD